MSRGEPVAGEDVTLFVKSMINPMPLGRAETDDNGEAVFDAEHFFDGYKANPAYALDCLRAAHGAGARWVVLCDTNGGTLPDEIGAITAAVIAAGIPGERLGIHTHDDTGNAVAGSLAAIEVLTELYGNKPIFIREGGSVPILSLLLEHLGIYATSFGFALNDEKFHAPDEFFRLKSFELGQQAYCQILQRLGDQP